MDIGENKTLNAAFESDDYDEKYLDKIIPYVKGQLVEVTDFIEQAKNDSRQ